MHISFQATWPLLLLLPALVLVWWARRGSLIAFRPRQLDLMAALRAVALVLVIVAMMQPVLYRTGSWLSTVYLLDVSRSISAQGIEDAIAWIERAEATGVSERSRFVAFGGNARLVDEPGQLRSIRVADGPAAGAVDRSRTNLRAALERGVAALPPHHVPRLVLLSDGNATDGQVEQLLQQLQLDEIRLDTRPTPARFEADTWIESVRVPSTVTAGRPFRVVIEIYAQTNARGTITILAGEQPLVAEQIDVEPGASSVTLPAVLENAGPQTLQVRLQVAGDPEPDNNRAEVSLYARAQAKVLYIEGRPESSQHLAEALRQGGLDVNVATPPQIPTRAATLEPYAAVIVSDVLADAISPASMRALATYVEQLGGGLIVAGGESVFGEKGYADTLIETIMPVWFKAEREPKDMVLVIALDKSYSMVGDKMALAKEASKAAVRQLEDEQQFGLLAFDYHFYWPVPIQSADDKAGIEQRISGIEASSPTNIYPALQDIYESLLAIDAEVKHVILLSDGKTYEDDYEGLVTKMTEAEITVSTVAVGDKADRELLGNIARWGKGRAYYIQDPSRVPEIFIDETQMAQGITIEEGGEIVTVVRNKIETLAGLDLERAPPLLGYVRTMPKEHAEVVLEADGEEPDPILVRWQYGLGRTVLFASDVKNRWSARWLEWEGYGKFWTQLVRETMRQSDDGELELSLLRSAGTATVTLDLVDERGRFRNAQRPTADVVRGDGETYSVALLQVAPGRYQASFASPESEALAVRWRAAAGTALERRLLARPPAETGYRAPDESLLRRLAAATGGIFDPTLEQLRAADGRSVVRPLRLWPGLAALALALYLVNMLLRRIRVFGGLEETAPPS